MILKFDILDKDKRILYGHVGVKGEYTEDMRVQLSDTVDTAVWLSGADIKSILRPVTMNIVNDKRGNSLARYTVRDFVINDAVYPEVSIIDDFHQTCNVDVVLPNSMFSSGTQMWDFINMRVKFDLPNICSCLNEGKCAGQDIRELGYTNKDAELFLKAPSKWRENYTVSEVLDKIKASRYLFEGLSSKEELLYKNARQELKDLYAPKEVVKIVKRELNPGKMGSKDDISEINFGNENDTIYDLDELTEDEAALFSVAPTVWKEEYEPRDVVRMMVHRGGTNYTDDELLGLGIKQEDIELYHMAPSVWKKSLMPKDVVDRVKHMSNK